MKADQGAGGHPIPEPGRSGGRGRGCMPMCLILDLSLSLSLVLFIEPVRGCCLLVARVHWICATSTHVLLNNKTAPRTEFFCMDLLSPQMNPAFGPVTNCRSTWLHRALLLRGKKSSGCECGRQAGRAYGEHWFSTFPTNLANRCLYLCSFTSTRAWCLTHETWCLV